MRLIVRVGAILAVLLLLGIMPPAFADHHDYYADLNIYITDNGEVQFSGTTDHPELMQNSFAYTSKNREYWTLNLSPEGTFSEFIFDVHFPEGAVINYLKVPNKLSITQDDGSVVITSTGTNEPLYILAQYYFNGQAASSMGYTLAMVILVLLAAGYIAYRLYSTKTAHKMGNAYSSQKGQVSILADSKEMARFNPASLPERQRDIMGFILKNNGSATQSELQRAISIPKASLSRNIDSLVRRGLLSKEAKGMTNFLTIVRK